MFVKAKDNVVVISGKDKGKKGKVIAAQPKANKVVVEGVAIATKHQKARAQGQPGGIIKKEAFIDASNVMVVCPQVRQAHPHRPQGSGRQERPRVQALRRRNRLIRRGKTMATRLHEKYLAEVRPALQQKFGYENVMQIPRLEKVIINMGLGDCKDNAKALETAVAELTQIAGQKPLVTKAKKSVANFKLRQGMNVGAKVTLRGARMEEFIDKLVSIALPRVRDFRGVSAKAFDGRGNYALGVKEQLIFPEIEYDKVEKIRGMEMIFVTTAKTDEEAKELLRLLGMPFEH